ncbi:hypothetical protein CTI12_AA297630 [Artemisia annua]|uniref:Helitron helicase-like domain-containing protein n=1 Tax=Artemisia annua TaxID=35608 RepID=A0A2U1N807_ARTAN|nr:hypothetical protein CTI12_AA297630 [Artemisia annua]
MRWIVEGEKSFVFGAMRVNKFDVEDNLETIEPVGFAVIVSSRAGHSVRPLIYGVKLTHKCGSLWEWYVLMKQADIVGCGYLILPKALPAFYVKIRQAQSTCSWFGPLITPQTLGESMTVYMGNGTSHVRASRNVHENDDAGDLPSVPIPAIEDTTAPRAPVYAPAEKPTSRVSSSTAEFLERSMPEPSCGGAPSASTSHRTTPTCSGPPAEYRAFKSCECVCSNCHARFCYEDRLSNSIRRSGPLYHRCCHAGKVRLFIPQEYLEYIHRLFSDPHFLNNIRAYIQMFAMTFAMTINAGRGPYVFKVSGQIYHCIRRFCPEAGQTPRFLQLYIYDTEHDVSNRLSHFRNEENL